MVLFFLVETRLIASLHIVANFLKFRTYGVSAKLDCLYLHTQNLCIFSVIQI